jgi:hypothetical protein
MTRRNFDFGEIVPALSRPGITPDELHQLGVLPLCRSSIYEAVKRGEIEHLKFGKKIVIPTAPLRRKLGIEDAREQGRDRAAG